MAKQKVFEILNKCKSDPALLFTLAREQMAKEATIAAGKAKEIGVEAATRVGRGVKKDVKAVGSAVVTTTKIGLKYTVPTALAFGAGAAYQHHKSSSTPSEADITSIKAQGVKAGNIDAAGRNAVGTSTEVMQREARSKETSLHRGLGELESDAKGAAVSVIDAFERTYKEYHAVRAGSNDTSATTQNKLDKAPILILGAEAISKVTGEPRIGAGVAAAIDTVVTEIPKAVTKLAYHTAYNFGEALTTAALEAGADHAKPRTVSVVMDAAIEAKGSDPYSSDQKLVKTVDSKF